MSISVQLEAPDDQVVSYLKKLWTKDNQIVSSFKNDSNENSNKSKLSISETPSKSIIQQLIDSKVISSVHDESCIERAESKNSNELDSNKCDESLPVPAEQNETIIQNDQTIELNKSEEKQEAQLIQSDYIEIQPITIQLTQLTKTDDSQCVEDNPTCEDCSLNQNDIQAEQVEQIELDTGDKNKFCKQVKENLSKIREIGFRVYHDIGLEKEVNLVTSSVTNNDINKVYDFKTGTAFTRKSLMGDVSRCIVFPKYKSGDPTKPENFRYLVNHHNTVKILDRIWCSELITKCGTNLPDRSIYKSTLVKAFNGSIITTASENTKSFDDVVMVDIMKAFDSLDWDILEDLLMVNLTRKINKETASELVTQYMTILKNRELYYNNTRVEVSKGIPTGLPSSNLVFTLAMEEILYRWFNSSGYKNDIDFKLNVYVDDIYMKILNVTSASEIVNSLITHLENYKFKVNKEKTKADEKLKISGLTNYIEPSDYYLGIPFTRDVKLYGNLILKEIENKLKIKSWLDIYNILTEEQSSYEKLSLYGFLCYKLRPFYDNTNDTDEFGKEFIINFVYENFAKELAKNRENRFNQHIFVTMIVIISFVSIAFLTSSNNNSSVNV